MTSVLFFLRVKDRDKIFHGGTADDQPRQGLLLTGGVGLLVFGLLLLFACWICCLFCCLFFHEIFQHAKAHKRTGGLKKEEEKKEIQCSFQLRGKVLLGEERKTKEKERERAFALKALLQKKSFLNLQASLHGKPPPPTKLGQSV